MHTRPPTRLAAILTTLLLLVTISPLTAATAAPTNLGLGGTVTSSGHEPGTSFTADRAFDGDPGPVDSTDGSVHNHPDASRWSGTGEPIWIAVDLGAPATLDSVRIRWGNTFATDYALQGSADGVTWADLATGLAGARASWSTVDLDRSGIRHLRVQVNTKSTQWPVAIWEIEALGTLEGPVAQPVHVDVIPKPVLAVAGSGGDFTLDGATVITASGDAVGAAEAFAEVARPSTGLPLPLRASSDGNAIGFSLNTDLELPGRTDEQYRLSATSDGVVVEAPSEAGLFYGAQTLLQLLGPWVRSPEPVAQSWTVPGVTITDGPRYEYRGFMLDVARSFMELDEVKQIIDEMAAHKLNVLHLHLSDDQGWRIAIGNEGRVEGDTIDYTQLALKSGATAIGPMDFTDLPGRTGYYTADDFAEIIRYADEHHIAIVPEIDGPGHANSMLHAIPELNSAGSLPQPPEGQATTLPHRKQENSSLDANNEQTYVFLRHVFRQLLEQNTSRPAGMQLMHVGGDEAWLTDDADFRTYIGRVTDIVTDLGATPMVWREAASYAPDQLPDGTVIHQWDAAVNQATRQLVLNRGMKLVVSATKHNYLPQRPGVEVAAPAWQCATSACDINQYYNWDPTALTGVPEASVLGPSTALWVEHIRSLNSAEYMMYPRVMVSAEVAWTPQSLRGVTDFRERLKSLGTALTVEGRNFYPGDAVWELDVRGRQVGPLTTDDELGTVGWASLPRTDLSAVSATLQMGGTTVPLTVEVDRAYIDATGQTADNRQANSLFVLSSDATLPAGEHTGTISVTVGGVTETASLPITVTAEPEPSPEPTTPGPTTPAPSSPAPTKPAPPAFVRTVPYTKPGLHTYNGREWSTVCEPYSQTERCRTEIWASVVQRTGNTYSIERGWAFNNLTYLPFMQRSQWANNPLGGYGRESFDGGFVGADGARWRTECDTAATGRNACRSYRLTTVYFATPRPTGGYLFGQENKWVFNNIVMFGTFSR